MQEIRLYHLVARQLSGSYKPISLLKSSRRDWFIIFSPSRPLHLPFLFLLGKVTRSAHGLLSLFLSSHKMVSGLASMPVTINKVEDPCRACRGTITHTVTATLLIDFDPRTPSQMYVFHHTLQDSFETDVYCGTRIDLWVTRSRPSSTRTSLRS